MNLFGKAKKVPTAQESIMKLKDTLEVLEKREKYLETKIEKELTEAKKNATKNKRGALMALKRKKAYEGQIEKIAGARLTIEQQLMAIEDANVNVEAISAMRSGASALRNIHGNLNINKVDDVMDEIRDQMDLAKEITDAISQPVGFGQEFDDDELSKELDDLEQEALDSYTLDIKGPINGKVINKADDVTDSFEFPVAPNNAPPPVADGLSAEERELKELEASMAV